MESPQKTIIAERKEESQSSAGKKRLSKRMLESNYIDDLLNQRLLKLGLPYKK